MKKFITIILLVVTLLAAIPVQNVEAKTKVAKPTMTVEYNMSKKAWYGTFHCKTKGVTVYYCESAGEKEYKVKPEKAFKLKERFPGYFDAYAKKGKSKSNWTRISTYTLCTKARNKDMHKEVDKYVDKSADDFTRLAQICNYFSNNYQYVLKGGSEPWYDKTGKCSILAREFKYLCTEYDIKCEYVYNTYKAGYDYKTNHAWTHVYIDNQLIVIDPTGIAFCSKSRRTVDKAYEDDVDAVQSMRGKLVVGKYTFNVLDYCLSDDDDHGTFTYEKNKITRVWDDGSKSIYTYSEEKGYWTKEDYDIYGNLEEED